MGRMGLLDIGVVELSIAYCSDTRTKLLVQEPLYLIQGFLSKNAFARFVAMLPGRHRIAFGPPAPNAYPVTSNSCGPIGWPFFDSFMPR
jgi:hypothetical protein